MEETAPTGADNDVASMAATITSVDMASEAVAEAADAEPAKAAARIPPLTMLAETAFLVCCACLVMPSATS